jgi:hypothetical protein
LDSEYGQHDAGWLSFYDFFSEVCGLRAETAPLRGLMEIAKSAGWFLPHKNICWISERHNILNRDDRGRLHSLSGPALAYPDGWGIYAVHGMRVSEKVILHPDQITVSEIDNERNAEVRRVMIDQYNPARYLIDSHAEIIHQDERGTLYRRNISDDEPIVMVKVQNSTPEPDGSYKDYFLRVPPHIQTASQAVAWTFASDEQFYSPAVES